MRNDDQPYCLNTTRWPPGPGLMKKNRLGSIALQDVGEQMGFLTKP